MPKKAVPGSAAAEKYLEAHKRGEVIRESAAARRYMEREVQLIYAWIQTLDLNFDDLQSEKEKIEEIKKIITKRILGG